MGEPSRPARPVRFGAFTVDLRAGELRRNGRTIRLPEQPFLILSMLLERAGDVVTRDELRQRLWPADTFVDFDHGLNNAIKKLRDVLDDSAESPRFIETLPKRGYRFICPLDRDGVLQAAEARPTAPLWHRRWLAALLIGLTALLVGLFAANVLGLRDWALRRPASKIASIAVLPFENLTGDPGQEYLADGISDELTTVLARIKAIRVPSRTSALTYKGKRKPLREIASELKVEAVMEGSVVRAQGGTWTIDVQLIDGKTDRHLWAKTYLRNREDLSALSTEVVRDIISEAKIDVSSEEQRGVLRNRRVAPEAYEAYLKGDYYYRKRTKEDLYKGLDYFRQAIDADPTYAPAYDGLATTYWLLCAYSYLSPREAFPKAKAAALKAVELDDTLGKAHATLGRILLVYDWNWAGAEREFQRAQQLERNLPLTSFYLVAMGRFDEAIAAGKEAVESDPLSPATSQHLAWAYLMAGRYDDSIAQLKKTMELDPRRYHPHDMLARNYALKKMYPEALAECDQALGLLGEQDDPVVFSDCGWINALAGRRTEALRLEQKLIRPAAPRWVDPLFQARIELALGNRDTAIRLLYDAYDARSSDVVLLKASEFLGKELSSDPRFQELLRRTGVPW